MSEEGKNETSRRSGRRGSSGPTVSDVAKKAGVSLMTVSRVVNGESSVLPATRLRVEQAIGELGYVPNPAARSLAGGRQCRIALVYNNPSTAYLSEFLVGSLEGATQNDAQLTVENWDGVESVESLARRFRNHRIDAVLLPPPLCEHAALIEALSAVHIRVAQVAAGEPSSHVFAVTLEDEEAAHAITSHLVALGHRRIGFIAGNLDQSVSVRRRMGYERAIAQAGLEIDPDLIQQGDFTYRSGMIAAERLLSLDNPPSAIFASNDDMAAGVLSVAHRRHLEVPDDLSVCGYDDTAMATSVWPELTTIRQPIADMAREATALLSKAKRSKGAMAAPQHRQLPYELVERGSTARKRARR